MDSLNGKPLEITPVSAWVEEYEIVYLPYAKKHVGLRQADVMSILTSDGQIPNMLLPVIQGQMTPSQAQSMEVDMDDLSQLNGLLNKLVRACFVQPLGS